MDFCDAEIIRELRHMHELVPVHVSAALTALLRAHGVEVPT